MTMLSQSSPERQTRTHTPTVQADTDAKPRLWRGLMWSAFFIVAVVSIGLGASLADGEEGNETKGVTDAEAVKMAAHRSWTQHPGFPQVKGHPKWSVAPVPLKSQERRRTLMRQVSGGELEVAAKAHQQLCKELGNYRLPMTREEGGRANALCLVWEGAHHTLARRYREAGLIEKATVLERELVKWGSGSNLSRITAMRLQEGLVLIGTLVIPPGPHKPDARVLAVVSLRNDNDVDVRTHVELETAKGFDKAYDQGTGRWNPLNQPVNLTSSSTYDITIGLHDVWIGRVPVTAHQLKHVGSYWLRIKTGEITCDSNTADVSYVGR